MTGRAEAHTLEHELVRIWDFKFAMIDALKVGLTTNQKKTCISSPHVFPKPLPHSYIRRKTSGSVPRPFFIAQNQDNGGRGRGEGGDLSCQKGYVIYIMKSWAKKEEARDKHIYVGSVAQSRAGNDWHRDLNSDLLILNLQSSSTSQPL